MEQASRATGGHQHIARVDGVRLALMRVECHHAFDLVVVLGHHQIGHIPFLGEFDAFGDALLPKRKQDLMSDTVGRIRGTSDGFLAEILGMSSEPTLRDVPILGA